MAAGIASQAVNSIMGNAERAIIEITDYRKRETNVQSSSAPGASSGIGGFAKVAGMSQRIAAAAAALTSSEAINSFATSAGAAHTAKQFKVQFNPSTLKLSAQSSECTSVRDVSGSGENVSGGAVDVIMNLSVQLIFDRVNNQDAFMNEKFVLNPTSIVSGAAKGIVNTVTGREYTVQPQVEGFIAALRNSNTRLVTFCWGNLHYTGVLKRVDSKYTMFSVSGRPIRAVVDLEIELSDPSIASGQMGEWQNQFNAAFRPNTPQI